MQLFHSSKFEPQHQVWFERDEPSPLGPLSLSTGRGEASDREHAAIEP